MSVLARPGTPIISTWPCTDEGDEEVAHDFLLADDPVLEFLREALVDAADAGEKLDLFLGEIGVGGHR